MTDTTPWLPSWFAHPTRLELDSGHHLRPLRAVDVDPDLPAVAGSQPSLWARFGAAWGWPPRDLTVEADRADLERQEREMEQHVSFTYGVLDEAEQELVGCVYLDPPRGGRDVDPVLAQTWTCRGGSWTPTSTDPWTANCRWPCVRGCPGTGRSLRYDSSGRTSAGPSGRG